MEGGREVGRQAERHNLDVVLSVRYRAKSQRGIEFCRWANGILDPCLMRGSLGTIYQSFDG